MCGPRPIFSAYSILTPTPFGVQQREFIQPSASIGIDVLCKTGIGADRCRIDKIDTGHIRSPQSVEARMPILGRWGYRYGQCNRTGDTPQYKERNMQLILSLYRSKGVLRHAFCQFVSAVLPRYLSGTEGAGGNTLAAADTCFRIDHRFVLSVKGDCVVGTVCDALVAPDTAFLLIVGECSSASCFYRLLRRIPSLSF